YRDHRTYDVFGWGEELTQQVVDPTVGMYTGASLTSKWFYYTVASDPTNYSRLKQYVSATGYWERHRYDDHFRETNTIVGFGNTHAPVDPDSDPAGQLRVTATRYNLTQSPDKLTVTTTEKLLGNFVSTNYVIYTANQEVRVRCPNPGAPE